MTLKFTSKLTDRNNEQLSKLHKFDIYTFRNNKNKIFKLTFF